MIDNYSYKEPVSIEKAKQILEEYKKTLSKKHNRFVERQLKKKYNTVTNTITIGERSFTGTYRENSDRKNRKDAYRKETKISTVLSSKGFDIILLKETERKIQKNDKTKRPDNTKSDALVNGIVMDFKEITGTSKNTLGKNYQDSMRKKHSQGAVLFLVNNMTEKEVFEQLAGKTRSQGNGLVLVYHENTDGLQIINMKNLRAAHDRTARIGRGSKIKPPYKSGSLMSQPNKNIPIT